MHLDRHWRHTVRLMIFSAAVIGGPAHAVHAASPPKVILDQLLVPAGIAIQPETGHVFIAESGKGRILRVLDGKAEEVAIEFPVTERTEKPRLPVGPQGLLFLQNDTMLVSAAGMVAGKEVLYVVPVSKPGESAVRADECLRLGPLAEDGEHPSGDNFFSMVQVADHVLFGAWDSRAGNCIYALHITRPNQLDSPASYGKITRFANLPNTDRPAQAMAMCRGGANGELAVAFAGMTGAEADSDLCFFRLQDAGELMRLSTGRYDITAIGYGGTQDAGGRQHLYVLDAAWEQPSEGGLFRLDAKLDGGRMSLVAVLIAAMDHPLSMQRGLDGALYVTTVGPSATEPNAVAGQLLRFEPGL
jgi:hypothetical protein